MVGFENMRGPTTLGMCGWGSGITHLDIPRYHLEVDLQHVCCQAELTYYDLPAQFLASNEGPTQGEPGTTRTVGIVQGLFGEVPKSDHAVVLQSIN